MHKLADIFVASFEISFEEQLSMLDSVDVKVRISKATELVDRHLQVASSLVMYFVFEFFLLPLMLIFFFWSTILL